MKKKITIVDYGLGNILSAKQSFAKIINDLNICAEVNISNVPSEILASSHVVLPGQGAFKSCIDGLKKINGMTFNPIINEWKVSEDKSVNYIMKLKKI